MATKTKVAINIRPLHDKIIVLRDEAEERTESGIFLPGNKQDKPRTGTVKAVGDGALNTETGERIPLTVKKNDKVIFSSYAGSEVKIDGIDLLIMSEDDVQAVIED